MLSSRALYYNASDFHQPLRWNLGPSWQISGLTKAEPSDLSNRLQALFEVLVGPDVD
jgi:hypothetical protein